MKVNWKSALSLTLALVLTVSAVPATRVEASEAITDVMLSEENMEVVTQEIPGDDDSQTPNSDKGLEEEKENEDLENEDSKNALDEEISSGVLEEKKEEAPDQKEEKEEATVSGSSLGEETTEESVSDSSLGLMLEETQQSESPIVEVEILAAEEENIASGTITNEQGGITWKIDAAGKLTVTGKGEILGSPTE
ncbi:MAG: hypothetical protein IKL51_10200, partial [Lachnospiraceae bacterium]|nr:hypothetical protein [Lachnospiraceae bacterium]